MLDIEETKLDNVYILKVRNPHGIIGNNLTKNLKANNCLGLLNKFFNEGKNGYIPKNRYYKANTINQKIKLAESKELFNFLPQIFIALP